MKSMNRRTFLSSAAVTGAYLTFSEVGHATSLAPEAPALPNLDYISAEATYTQVYEHFHLLSIPVAALINPPITGFTTRTSSLDQGSLDVVAFEKFITMRPDLGQALRGHSHEVKFTQEELKRIASGEKNVEVTVLTPMKRLAHKFFFTASKSALIKIKAGKALPASTNKAPTLTTVEAETDFAAGYEHYHRIQLPVEALVDIPLKGIVFPTSVVDQLSYDVAGFDQFIAQTKLPRELIRTHKHDVTITQLDLKRIASGEAVQIRIISPSKNFVHDFVITASPSALVKIRKGAKK